MCTEFSQRLKDSHNFALEKGELVFSESTTENVVQNGIEFEIRFAPSLAFKPAGKADAKKNEGKPANPFLPYNPTLLVQELDHHVVLLNKFCVVPYHILVVTKEFYPQTDPPLPKDFAAVWYCLRRFKDNALAFYNCGASSGASQPHKHIQIVPMSACPPIFSILPKIPPEDQGKPLTTENLPYIHAFTRLDLDMLHNATDEDAGGYLSGVFFNLYDFMIDQIRHHPTSQTSSAGFVSYNFLLSQDTMMLVPRTLEKWGDISINSLGFAGTLLVKSLEQLNTVKTNSILDILKSVSFQKTE
ncbi:uncharacterized protein VTP21DRAFT_2029 [Calcarisporiella thermophila]|uniref:uncharacterized protein n=1 Tax=Calcarisporiella thermophila TaxID=911321 RepID=UPI0037449554